MARRPSTEAVAPRRDPGKPATLHEAGLDALNLGFAVFDRNLRLVTGNKPLAVMRGYPASLLRPGTDIIELYRSTKLSKYLSPQLYKSIFSGEKNVEVASQRKKLTIFFSDIAGFTETTDLLESRPVGRGRAPRHRSGAWALAPHQPPRSL